MRPTTKVDNAKKTTVTTLPRKQVGKRIDVHRLLVESFSRKVDSALLFSRSELRMRYQGTASPRAMRSFANYLDQLTRGSGACYDKIDIEALTFSVIGGSNLNYEAVVDLTGPTDELEKRNRVAQAEPISYDESGMYSGKFKHVPIGSARLLELRCEGAPSFYHVYRLCAEMERTMHKRPVYDVGNPVAVYDASIVRLFCKRVEYRSESLQHGYYVHALVAVPLEMASHYRNEMLKSLKELIHFNCKVVSFGSKLTNLQYFPAPFRLVLE